MRTNHRTDSPHQENHSKLREGCLILANPLNELSHLDAAPELASNIDLSAFQELWLIQPGDVFVTPRPLPPGFLEMVCEYLNLDPDSFRVMTPQAQLAESLIDALKRTGMQSQLRELAKNRPEMRIRSCALDRGLIEISKSIGLQIEGFNQEPSESLIDTVYLLNTKSGFRNVAKKLGLRIAPGVSAIRASEVGDAVRQILLDHEEAIVKCDRNSGVCSHFIVNRTIINGCPDLVSGLQCFLQDKSDLGHTFVVEGRLALRLDPTIDVEITPEGPKHLYVGAMDCANGVFLQGMSVPAQDIPDRSLAELRLAADRIGRYLYNRGYRGFFDIDGGLTEEGDLYLFEANVRRTSTSLWDAVLDRVLGSAKNHDFVWRVATQSIPHEVAREPALLLSKLQQLIAQSRNASATLITLASPSKACHARIRHLVAATSWNHVVRMEQSIAEAFKFRGVDSPTDS